MKSLYRISTNHGQSEEILNHIWLKNRYLIVLNVNVPRFTQYWYGSTHQFDNLDDDTTNSLHGDHDVRVGIILASYNT